MKINEEKFIKEKERAEEFYKNLSSVHCPFLKEKVNFNIKGLDHIKFKRWGSNRFKGDQYMRLKLIRYAPEIIKKSHTLQGYSKTKEFERKKINSRWVKVLADVSYYEFVAILDGIRVRVIIKQVLGGEKHFWSIIPFWKMNGDNERLLHNGNPTED